MLKIDETEEEFKKMFENAQRSFKTELDNLRLKYHRAFNAFYKELGGNGGAEIISIGETTSDEKPKKLKNPERVMLFVDKFDDGFTKQMLWDLIVGEDKKFADQIKPAGLSSVLGKLVSDKLIEIVKERSGRIAAVYKKK